MKIWLFYDGEWDNSGKGLGYNGGQQKGLLVQHDITFNEIKKLISCSVSEEEDSGCPCAVTLWCLVPGTVQVRDPMKIAKQSDFDFFLALVNDNFPRCVPLYVTRQPKEPPRAEIRVFQDACPENAHTPERDGSSSQNSFVFKRATLFRVEPHVSPAYGDSVDDLFDDEEEDDRLKENELLPSLQANEISQKDGDVVHVDDQMRASTSGPPPDIDGQMNKQYTSEYCKEFEVGELFESKIAFQKRLSIYAYKMNFEFKFKKSQADRVSVVCDADNCTWSLYATKFKNSSYFRVRRYHKIHTCSRDSTSASKHKHITSRIIEECLKNKQNSAGGIYKTKDIIEEIQKDLGITISYHLARSARERAVASILGSAEESYASLPSYCAELEKSNPGTVTCISTDASDNFKYFFMLIGACLRGFLSSVRPVISVGGTDWKAKYRGTLFFATCKDGNDQLFPLAFGIGDLENDASWHWFLSKLRTVIGDVADLVIISSPNASIEKGVRTVFPEAVHGGCLYHIGRYVKKNCKNDILNQMFHDAAKCYRMSDFNHIFHQIRQIFPDIASKLAEAGFEKWSRSHFNGIRYNIMTTNIEECISLIVKDIDDLHVTKLIELVSKMFQSVFDEHREAALGSTTTLTKWAEDELRKRMNQSSLYSIHPINMDEFQIFDNNKNAEVKLNYKTCTCRVFDLDQLPCAHVMAVCKFRNLDPYQYCSRYYYLATLKEAYSDSIHPVSSPENWEVSEEVRSRVVLPPGTRRPCGRPGKRKISSQEEGESGRKCGKCGLSGHNRQRCEQSGSLFT